MQSSGVFSDPQWSQFYLSSAQSDEKPPYLDKVPAFHASENFWWLAAWQHRNELWLGYYDIGAILRSGPEFGLW